MRDDRIQRGVRVGWIAWAATAGVLASLSMSRGSPLAVFASLGTGVLGRQPEMVAVIVGILTHCGLVIALTVALTLLAEPYSAAMRLVVAAAGAVVLLPLMRVILSRALPFPPIPTADLATFCAAYFLAVAVGMRIASVIDRPERG